MTPVKVTSNVSKDGSSKSPSGESSSSQMEVGWMTPALAKTRSQRLAVLWTAAKKAVRDGNDVTSALMKCTSDAKDEAYSWPAFSSTSQK